LADPLLTVLALRDDNSLFVDDPHDAAGGERLRSQRILKTIELDADGDNRAKSAGLILYRGG
jgi:hypothetical protein